MKYIFVKPITDLVGIIPHPGIPSLIGILENLNIECEYIDLNADYDRNITKEDVINSYNELKSFYKNEEYLSFPEIYREGLARYEYVYEQQLSFKEKNIDKFSLYKNLLKTKKYMYNNLLFTFLTDYIDCIKSCSILIPCSCVYGFEKNDVINIADILFLFNSRLNNFKTFYEKKIYEIINKNPTIVGIQITSIRDFLSGLLLAYMLKQKDKSIHINIGGNYFEEVYKKIDNLKHLFDIFFDSISIGESTGTVEDLTKYVNNKLPIGQVRNLLYIQDGEVKFNESTKHEIINRLPFQSFTGYQKEDYILPELVLPMRAATTYSCYWGNCIYCNCSARGNNYVLMSAKRFVDELEYLSEKYDTKYFSFWDNAMHPKYLDKVADLILEKKLKIKFSLYARLEKEFDEKLLKKLNKAGCIAIHWGLDSVSPRILQYINKGIDIETAKRILKDSRKAGIFNFVYLIFGYPTETIEEIKDNLKFVKENIKNMDYVNVIDRVLFFEGSIMYNNQEYYEKLIDNSEEFIQTKNNVRHEINKISKNNIIFLQFAYLYLIKYGKLRYKILQDIIYYYKNHEKTFLKKIINIYWKFELFKAKLLLRCKE